MLVTLQRNSTNLGNSITHQGIFLYTVVKILTGEWTTPSHLAGAGAWNTGACRFDVGSYPEPGYWTVAASSYTALSSAGWYLLSKPCLTTNKTNYLYVAWGQTGNTLLGTALGVSGGSAVDLYTLNTGSYSAAMDTSNQMFYLRFADNFVHFFSDGYGFTADTISSFNDILWFEFNPYGFDQYSPEGSLKMLIGNSVLYINSLYSPHYDACTAGSTITGPTNLSLARSVGTSRGSDLGVAYPRVPLLFSNITLGWLGGDVSEATGWYRTTNGCGITGQTLTLQDQSYILRVCSPSSTLAYLCRY